MVLEEKTIDSERIYEGSVISLRKDRVSIEGGGISWREIVEHRGGVAIAALTGEALMDVVTGLSGGGPAYAYLFIDALAKGAARNGMDEGEARRFAAQSVLGAAKMTLETGIDPLTLCQNVCSPGGTTIEAVECLRRGGFETLVAAGLQAAVDKSKKLTK
jgi:pyrroline-5-carboxylate reductase